MSDLTNLDDIRQQATLLRAKERKARTFSWLSLGQSIAYLLLLASFGIWLRVYIFQIGPRLAEYVDGRWQTTVSLLLGGILDTLMAVAGGAASAVIPALFISALIPNTPAALVLARLKVRYGWTSYVIPLVGGAVMTVHSYETLVSFWASRPDFTVGGVLDVGRVESEARLWTLLLIGFPAWALNQLTPAQWVDTLLDSILAARIHLAIDLQEEIAAAIKVRAKAVLYADVASMTIEQRQENARQIAAIQAGIMRDLRGAMQQVLGEADARHNMALVVMPSDSAIIDRHRQLAETLAGTTDDLSVRTDYVEAMGAPDLPRTPVALPVAQTEGSTDASARTVTDRDGPRKVPRTVSFADELRVAAREFGRRAFTRSDLESALSCEKSKAAQCIASWKRDALLHELTENKYHYTLTEEAFSWLV